MDVRTVPESWQELTFGVENGKRSAQWAHDTEPVLITADPDTDDNFPGSYNLIVEQLVGDDEYEASVTTHASVLDTWDGVESEAIEIMEMVDSGNHVLRLLKTDTYRDFVRFFCISDDELPGEVTADELIDALEDNPYESDVDGQIDYEDADVVVDVYTRPKDDKAVVGTDTETDR